MGLGFIGREVAKAVLSTPGLLLSGAIDSSEGLVGKPLSEIVPGAPDLVILPDASDAFGALRGGALLLATGSRFLSILPQIEPAVRRGVHVVATCEELAFPWLNYEEQADALDGLAREHGVSVLGTGVNPGFVLDRLVATAGAPCGKIRRVHAQRVVDARSRREALQKKVGAGMTLEDFEARLDRGEVGHVGLPESAALCALGLGLDYDELEEETMPVVAEEDIPGPIRVKKGQVAGTYQRARGFFEGREVVDLELTIALGMPESFDLIEIDAEPRVEIKVTGGYAGETATAFAVANAVSQIVDSEPGILTVLSLPAGRR
jgi:4-hydroxy-tetrahydrodipicolinate reductase